MSMRVAVVGGSVGGLAAAVALTRVGLQAVLHERSSAHMAERGAGIVMQPALATFIEDHDLGEVRRVSTGSVGRQTLSRSGEVVSREAFPQRMTAWDTLFRLFRGALPASALHFDERLSAIDTRRPLPRLCFNDSTAEEECDLVVLADGGNSTGRRLLLPDSVPRYSGYVAWRGVVDEIGLDEDLRLLFSDRLTVFQGQGTQILAYFIPGADGAIEPGQRRLNWVWYWNVPPEGLQDVLTDREGRIREWSVPPGLVSADLCERQRERAHHELPRPFARLFDATARPFVQPIHDVAVSAMVCGRVVLVGDAAFVARPHMACNATKACVNASTLAAALVEHGSDLAGALQAWEATQLEMGRGLCQEGIALGNRSQFPR